MLTLHFIVGTLIPASYHYYVRRSSHAHSHLTHNESSRMVVLAYRASWVLFTISANVAFAVTALYWGVVHTPEAPLDASTVNAHAVNSILVLIDILMSSTPVRILHMIYPMIYICTYAIFSVIYWAEGGTNPDGHPYIYAALDYENHPKNASVMVVLFVFAAIPVSQFIVYGLYRFRTWLMNCDRVSDFEEEQPASDC